MTYPKTECQAGIWTQACPGSKPFLLPFIRSTQFMASSSQSSKQEKAVETAWTPEPLRRAEQRGLLGSRSKEINLGNTGRAPPSRGGKGKGSHYPCPPVSLYHTDKLEPAAREELCFQQPGDSAVSGGQRQHGSKVHKQIPGKDSSD